MSSVARSFGVDFIYFDILFALIWIIALYRKGLFLELKFGLFGVLFVSFIDTIVWYLILGTRQVSAPINPILFLLYFSTTYGLIMFSFVAIMFGIEDNKSRLVWISFLYLGWLVSAFLSQTISIDDRIIITNRDMSRWLQIVITILGYLLLIIIKYKSKFLEDLSWSMIGYLFSVGVVVHFGMEISLFLSGIRPQKLNVLIFNSFIEFNNGIPILYLGWYYLKNKSEPVDKIIQDIEK